MARLWIACRDGLELCGRPVGAIPFDQAVTRLDLATWRRIADSAPREVDAEALANRKDRRTIVEVRPEDTEALSAFHPGFYDSPYSPDEALRRMRLQAD